MGTTFSVSRLAASEEFRLARTSSSGRAGSRPEGAGMAEHRRIWPLLIYAVLVAIAAPRSEADEAGTKVGGASVTGLAADFARRWTRRLTGVLRPIPKIFPVAGGRRQKAPRAIRERSADLPRNFTGRRSRGADGARRLRGKSRGLAGRISFGAYMRASMITDCSPSPQASSSIRCWRSFPRLPAYRSTD